MNEQEYLLTCLAEECDEVSQRICKALRFGLGEVQPGQPMNNAQRITAELYDLIAVAEMCRRAGILTEVVPSDDIIEEKRLKIERFKAISREQGVLQETGHAR